MSCMSTLNSRKHKAFTAMGSTHHTTPPGACCFLPAYRYNASLPLTADCSSELSSFTRRPDLSRQIMHTAKQQPPKLSAAVIHVKYTSKHRFCLSFSILSCTQRECQLTFMARWMWDRGRKSEQRHRRIFEGKAGGKQHECVHRQYSL